MKMKCIETNMINQYENAGNQNDIPTYLEPWGPKDHMLDDVR
jgi:hypothetical protein